MDKNNIGAKIAELRKSKNLSQADLAQKLCVSNKTISKWECGNGTPDIEILSKMSKIFDVTIDEMVNSTDKKEIDMEKQIKNNEELSNSKNISKKSLVTILSSAALILVLCVSLLCYFFIPRTPMVKGSDLFEINQENSTLYCAVDNNKSILSLNNQFEVPLTNKWGLYYDLNGTREISSKIVNLQIGDNTFYLIVENSANTKKVYTLTIRRKPMYVVTFDTNGGNSIVNQIVMEGELANLVTPEREGYIFNSWDFDFTQPITKNITIKASWIAKNLKVNYYANNGSENSLIQDVTYDTEVNLKDNNSFTKTGYTLSSWNTKPDGTGISYETNKKFMKYNIPSNLDLYAQWTINQYQIRCDKNIEDAGTIDGTGNFDYNTQHTLSVNTNAGYTWLGWYTKDGTIITTSTTLTITLSDNDYECVAKWSANNYFCSLDVNNGNTLAEDNKTITFGQPFNLPIPTRIEATFEGWYFNSVRYTNSQGVSIKNWDIPNTATLYAKWNVNKYLVTLTTNNTNGGSVIGEGLKEYGSSVSIKANTNAGYTFVGWYEGNNLITNNETYTFTMSNVALSYIAKWQANIYTFTFDENGGEELSPNTKDVVFDSSYKLPITTKTGYDFDGWYLGENGTGVKVTDKNGNSLNVWNVADNTTVYAKWNVTVYTISYTLRGGTIVGNNPTTYTIEDLDIIINNPTKAGYEFAGWVGTDIEDKEMSLIIKAGSIGNRVYGATWKEDSTFVAISNVTEFLAINDNLSGNYYLTNEIDLTGIQFDGFGDENNYFTGVFDGKGYKIINLVSSSVESGAKSKTYFGLFKYSSGEIINVGLENYKFTKSYACVGAIVGYNLGKIKNCYTNGNIEDSIMSGGIASYNEGLILNCYSKGIIKATEASMYTISVYSGGIVAKNVNGTIKNCFSVASISAKEKSRTSGRIIAGGICALNDYKTPGIIENTFFAGSLEATGSTYVDAIFIGIIANGDNSSENLRNCYYDQDVSIVLSSGNSERGYIDKKGVSVENKNLMELNIIGFDKYYDSNIYLNTNAVWITSGSDYPKLYWEK